MDAQGDYIADIHDRETYDENLEVEDEAASNAEASANAEFIVRAVNSHDELVEALEEARAALHFHYVEWDGEPEDAVPLQLARSKCDAALSHARSTDGDQP